MIQAKQATWKRWLGVVAMATMAVGCGSGEIELGGDAVLLAEGSADVHHGDLMYVMNQEELASRLVDGYVEFRPEHAFAGVLLHIAASSIDRFEVSYEKVTGGWSEWSPVEGQTPESETIEGTLSIQEMASGLRVRFGDATGAVDFVRAEFLPEIGPENGAEFDDEWDESLGDADLDEGVAEMALRRGGRYVPSGAANSASRSQYVAYEGAPAWRRSNCGGSLLSGTRRLGDYLKANFPGARSYGGYSCRPNTANTSKMSVHGTGRAIDVFVPLDRGQADNDLGDPIANWLIENQEAIGVTFIVWDRSSWGASRSGDGHRSYGGPHPHHDHLHIEISAAAARQQTPWYSGGGSSPPDTAVSCYSRTLGKSVAAGECVQMSYDSCGGGTCNWAQCSDQGSWTCTDVSACTGTNHGHSACAATPTPDPEPQPEPEPQPPVADKASCTSRTLGRTVDHGACVQMNYNSCGGAGTCQWAACDDGAWMCVPKTSCGGDTFGHADCAPRPKASCYSRTLGRSVEDGGNVQMSYTSCGGTCRWATCDDGDWDCTSDISSGTNYNHRSCN